MVGLREEAGTCLQRPRREVEGNGRGRWLDNLIGQGGRLSWPHTARMKQGARDPERVQEKCLPAAHAGSPVGGYKNFFRCTYGCLVVLLFVMIGSLVFKQIRWDRVLVLVPRRWGAVCLGCVFSMAPLVCAAPWWVGLILLWAWILWALWVRRPPGVPRDSATQCSLWFSWAAAPITEGSSLKWGW